jgi:hypothetical protein
MEFLTLKKKKVIPGISMKIQDGKHIQKKEKLYTSLIIGIGQIK